MQSSLQQKCKKLQEDTKKKGTNRKGATSMEFDLILVQNSQFGIFFVWLKQTKNPLSLYNHTISHRFMAMTIYQNGNYLNL